MAQLLRTAGVDLKTRRELLDLALRAKKATSGLLRHLLTSDAPGEQRRPKKRTRRATKRHT